MIIRYFLPVILFVFILFGCDKKSTYDFISLGNAVPDFSADSAYAFIEWQVKKGSRVPGTLSHLDTKNQLIKQLKSYLGKSMVGVQRFKKVVYGDTLELFNIIASINSNSTNRVLLCAHWDSRPYADEASTDELKQKPVIGADDGASGVAVLLEIARVMSQNPTDIGVDIVLFDGEDYGKKSDLKYYFLGSREWSENPPVKGYHPRFGILMDMVGAKGATFLKEGFSMGENPFLVDAIWKIANELGYSSFFKDEKGAGIADDHYVLNANLPFSTIDIINHSIDSRGQVIFPKHWHTEHDTIEIIDKQTLQAVGDVLLELIYNRIPRN